MHPSVIANAPDSRPGSCASEAAANDQRAQIVRLLHEHSLDIRNLIRRLLPVVGLRTSLLRVKVMTLLLLAAGELETVRIHDLLEQQVGMPLNLTNTRDVLRRLARAGLTVQTERRHYAASSNAVSELYKLVLQESAGS